jgi:hypothetical protein
VCIQDKQTTESLGGNESLSYKPLKQNPAKPEPAPVQAAKPAGGMQLVHASPVQLYAFDSATQQNKVFNCLINLA